MLQTLGPEIHQAPVLQAGQELRLGFGIHGSVHVVEQMTIVTRPFVLDFAGAYVGAPPEFSEDIWAEWEAEKREQFGVRWTAVRTVMSALEDLGIHLVGWNLFMLLP